MNQENCWIVASKVTLYKQDAKIMMKIIIKVIAIASNNLSVRNIFNKINIVSQF